MSPVSPHERPGRLNFSKSKLEGGDSTVLRSAEAAAPGRYGPEFNRNAAHVGPRLLMVASGIVNMWSYGGPATFAVAELRRLECADNPDPVETMERGVAGLRRAYGELVAADERWQGTAALFTAMLCRKNRAVIAHIGDARAYLLRGGELTQLTRDHLLGQALIDDGIISADELGTDPKHSLITRWLDGQRESEPAEIIAHDAEPGDRYLLATHEIRTILSAKALRDLLQSTAGDPQQAADEIVAAARRADSHDGIACAVADLTVQ